MIALELILKILSVVGLSMIKFIFGPITGRAEGLNIYVTMAATICGMMATVWIIAYFGDWIKRRFKLRIFKDSGKVRSEKQVKRREFFRRYGLTGVAVLTPVILTPIGGTLLALSLRVPREKIIRYMLVSAIGWSVLITSGIYEGVDLVSDLLQWLFGK
jgi:membrane protein DedA with SNARE-associated domain